MAEYTIELRQILASYQEQPNHDLATFKAEDDIIAGGVDDLFNFEYPFYNNSDIDRAAFEKYFCRHYYIYEIGTETVGLFKSRLQARLYDIMPTIKRYYDSERLEFDPLHDYDETRIYTTEDTGEQTNDVNSSRSDSTSSESSGSNTSNSKVLQNDTPQGPLFDIDSGKYLSEYTSNPSDSNSTDLTSGSSQSTINNSGRDTIHNVQQHTESVKGKRGAATYADLIRQYRDLATNVNLLICRECRDLFMMVM